MFSSGFSTKVAPSFDIFLGIYTHEFVFIMVLCFLMVYKQFSWLCASVDELPSCDACKKCRCGVWGYSHFLILLTRFCNRIWSSLMICLRCMLIYGGF